VCGLDPLDNNPHRTAPPQAFFRSTAPHQSVLTFKPLKPKPNKIVEGFRTENPIYGRTIPRLSDIVDASILFSWDIS
jgi:hypothetical protein